VTERDDRVLRGLYDLKNLFGDKWVPAILVALRDGPLRRVEILSTVNSYSIDENWTDKHAVLHDSILARTLKKMREQGLIVRESCDKSFPPEVAYSLTPAVAEVLTLAEPLIEWTRAHPEFSMMSWNSTPRPVTAGSTPLDVALVPVAASGDPAPRTRVPAGFIRLGCVRGRLAPAPRGRRGGDVAGRPGRRPGAWADRRPRRAVW
jgi:DNA-binding HxlR family transcriptional regulator